MTPTASLILSMLGGGPATMQMLVGASILNNAPSSRAVIQEALTVLLKEGMVELFVLNDGTVLYRVGAADASEVIP